MIAVAEKRGFSMFTFRVVARMGKALGMPPSALESIIDLTRCVGRRESITIYMLLRQKDLLGLRGT